MRMHFIYSSSSPFTHVVSHPQGGQEVARQNAKKKKKLKVSRTSVVLVLLFFFFPWGYIWCLFFLLSVETCRQPPPLPRYPSVSSSSSSSSSFRCVCVCSRGTKHIKDVFSRACAAFLAARGRHWQQKKLFFTAREPHVTKCSKKQSYDLLSASGLINESKWHI